MSSIPFRRIGPVLCGLLLLASAGRAVTLKEHFDKTVPLSPGSQVTLRNVNGGIKVAAWDRNEVRIEADKEVKAGTDSAARKLMDQVRIDVTPGNNGLRVETHAPKRGDSVWDALFGNRVNYNVKYVIHVPRQAAVDAESVNGGVSLAGTRGRARLETTNGAVDVELASLPGGTDLRFESTNGGIHVRLPHDARLSVDAETVNGRVSSDFAVRGGQPGKRSLRGDINGGGGRLTIRTTNGGIEILGH